MLSKEDNELLTRVGKGTPMGELIREYWIPALPSTEFPTPDAPAKRMRLLGENLVMFRDTNGDIGAFPEACPHRGASLYFGRNEECGLRCVYHGWKFDVNGNCMEMPSEPDGSNFKDKVKINSYPCKDVNRMVWIYMGHRETPPPFPEFDVNTIPYENAQPPVVMMEEANFFQNLEGDTDTSHLDWDHARLKAESGPVGEGHIRGVFSPQKNPYVQAQPAEYGAFYTGRRKITEDKYWHRINQFIFPIFTMVGGDGESASLRAHVPVDDTHSMLISMGGSRTKPLTEEDLKQKRYTDPFYPTGGYVQRTSNPLTYFHTVANKDNDYHRDYTVEKTEMMSGVPFVHNLQDRAMTELMASENGDEAIYDRSNEHLGTTDGMCIMVRKQVIGAARAHQEDGTVPPNVDDAGMNARVRHACVVTTLDGDWIADSKAQRAGEEDHTCICGPLLGMAPGSVPGELPAEAGAIG